MPPSPHSPLCTHSAPSLPEPLQSDILFTPLNAHAGYTCTDKGRRCAPDPRRVRGQWTDVGLPDLMVPLDRQQTTAPCMLRPPYLRGQIAPAACSTGRATDARSNAISVSVVARVDSAREKRVSFTEAVPTTKATSTTIKGSASPVEKEMMRHNVATLPNALTAYEAALAEYGTKLLSMTRRRKRAEHQKSRERLSRQKAVNEKYSDLSRPQAVAGSGRCVSSGSQMGGNAAQRRECGDSSLALGAIVSSCAKARKAESDIAAMRRGPDKKRCVQPAASLDHPCRSHKTDVGVGTPHAQVSSQNKDVTGASASSELVSGNIEMDVEDEGATETRRDCDTGDASARSSRRRDGWAQTDSSYCINSLVTSLSGRRQALRERGAKVAEDTLDMTCLITPPHLTPPRPLQRAYSSGPFTSCMSVESRKKKGTFSRIFPTSRVSSASAVADKSLDIDGWGFPMRTRQQKACDTRQKAFVFIRPRPDPRPLPRCHESRPYCDDKVWYLRDGLLCGRAWDDDENMDAHRLSLLKSRDPRWRRDDDIQRSTFTNIVPQYVLDEFAHRGQVRRAWRRWRQRLWAVRVHPPARFHDPEPTAGEGGESRWAGLMTWIDESKLPSTLP
ncbi:hypothetical protein TraAM80_07529 [Trypanosoma rangeli]|uniref:Uncharacterized protein n=1 Tax=Trypanosoma rangeli TaxID=5698 RepID=A0A422N4X3_TRYRA|nr:uncharacterized protein TraAM80_07529 [Trypanosoma rangeli]RNF00528.1 hypothetical protein TraAM80_07529 [Trypanosoma rangeli]|eukprot:RNF00528.1 hypothetical protein TraAM80_07529 [Trypanosoma rangeli]